MSSKSRRIIRLSLAVFILLLLSVSSPARIIYVDDDAAGANDGSSWADAYMYLQEALADANSAEKPVEIRVAQGIYKPNQGMVAIPEFDWRTATFQLIDGVALKGGYAGVDEPDPNLRDIATFETILSGDLDGNDVDVDELQPSSSEPSRQDNSYNVVTSTENGETAVLDGFTMTAGNARPMWVSPPRGAGIYIEYGDPTLSNCRFVRNSAESQGGGMYNASASPRITDCSFSENSAEFGGAIYNEESSPVLTNCVFIRNLAHPEFVSGCQIDLPCPGDHWHGGFGGAIYNEKSSPLLTACLFTGNSATIGGGTYNQESRCTMIECVFTGNDATYRPGGLWGSPDGGVGGAIYDWESNQVLANCVFTLNSALDGAAVYNFSSVMTADECKFIGNTAFVVGGLLIVFGGRGGAMCNYDSSMAVHNSVFSGNRAVYASYGYFSGAGGGFGGAMYNNEGSSSTLTNCTLTGNSGPYASLVFGDAVVTNCILWDNTVPQISGEASISFSNVQNGWEGEGNVDIDPFFVTPGYWADINDPNVVIDPNDPNAVWLDGDYHLKSQTGRWDPNSQSWVVDDVTSPCIDAGDPNSDWSSETWPHGGRINMGAYGGTPEASMSTPPEMMVLPRVAYIHKHSGEAAGSFQSLLSSYGCPTTLLGIEEVAAAPLDSYDLIIVGADTGSTKNWADAQSVAAIETSSRPVVGLGNGGYAFFGKLGLSIGYPNGGHGSQNSISVMDPNNPLFSTPYAIEISQEGTLQVYTETANVGLYLWPAPETVTVLGAEVDNPGYYPLALEHDRYFSWGFTGSPETMTEVGKRLFINVVIRAANVAWESEI